MKRAGGVRLIANESTIMFRMPWDNATAPSAMIEITDACNVSCACCYKKIGSGFKDLGEIEQDIEDACRLRPLHTLTISGGEPTLHPELCTIIQHIKQRGLLCFLLTNGVLVDDAMLRRFKNAGLDAILFHVDTGQRRSDLPPGPSLHAVKVRLAQLARLAVRAGIDASASMTLNEADPSQLGEIIDLFLENRDLNFLFLARGLNLGNLYGVNHAQSLGSSAGGGRSTQLTMESFTTVLRKRHALEPFSCIPDRDGAGTNWISYFIPLVHVEEGFHLFRIIAGRADLALIQLHRLFAGHYIQKTKQNTFITLVRILVNGLATLRPWATLRFAARALSPGARLCHKMIVYDHGPTWTAKGDLSYCEFCATGIVRSGTIVPCCLADYAPGRAEACC